jgi:F-type H+-transporting ATPase subunit delta
MSYKLSQRYAKSILGLAIEQGKLDAIHKDVLLLDETISGHRDLALMLKSPVIHADKKINVMSLIFKNKIEDITWQFIELVVKKGREGQLLNFGKSFIEQYNVLKSISKVSITTASELSEVVIQSIKESLEKVIPGTNLEVNTSVDASLIGGFKLQYGDNLYDASIDKKLRNLKTQFLDQSYVDKV